MPAINFDYPLTYLALMAIISVALSLLLYRNPHSWSNTINWILMTIRSVLLFGIMILLANPLIRQFQSIIEDPLYVIAIDDSESMLNGDSIELIAATNGLKGIVKYLNGSGNQIKFEYLSGTQYDLDSVAYKQQESNLNQWLRELDAKYKSQNLASIILLSDGQFNIGTSPAYFPLSARVQTIGIGDTIPPDDIILKNVLYNRIAYQGNQFPLVIEILNHGFESYSTQLEVWSDSKKLASQIIHFKHSIGLQQVEINIEASKAGIMPLSVMIKKLDEEKIVVNNSSTVFIDIVKGKPKILIAAPAPHPDLKAIAATLSMKDNYQIDMYLPSIKPQLPSTNDYDLVLMHNPYDAQSSLSKLIAQTKNINLPTLMIIGSRTVIPKLVQHENQIKVEQKRNQYDQVTGSVNSAFAKYELDVESMKMIERFPPLSVPYGSYQLPVGADVLLYQRIGQVSTRNPMLYVADIEGTKQGVFFGEGLWKWRMQEYATTDKTATFDTFFSQVIQYLATKEDKKKLRVYPAQSEFTSNELISIHAESYNELYERIFGQEIVVQITGPADYNQQFSFRPSSVQSKLEISGLKEGIYNFTATSNLNNETVQDRGMFTVKEARLEHLDQVANFDVLKKIAKLNDGGFYQAKNLDQLRKDLGANPAKKKIAANEDILPLITLKWVFFLLLLLATLEWSSRKYLGGY